jgi:hypothetical protein
VLVGRTTAINELKSPIVVHANISRPWAAARWPASRH